MSFYSGFDKTIDISSLSLFHGEIAVPLILKSVIQSDNEFAVDVLHYPFFHFYVVDQVVLKQFVPLHLLQSIPRLIFIAIILDFLNQEYMSPAARPYFVDKSEAVEADLTIFFQQHFILTLVTVKS